MFEETKVERIPTLFERDLENDEVGEIAARFAEHAETPFWRMLQILVDELPDNEDEAGRLIGKEMKAIGASEMQHFMNNVSRLSNAIRERRMVKNVCNVTNAIDEIGAHDEATAADASCPAMDFSKFLQ